MVVQPSDALLEASLRGVIRDAVKADKLDQMTLKVVRTETEGQLRLASGWFKSHHTWKDRSKRIVDEQVDACTRDVDIETASSPPPSPVAATAESTIEPRPKSNKRRKTGSDAESDVATDENTNDRANHDVDDASSELSVLFDDAPKPRKSAKSDKSAAKSKPKPSESKTASAASTKSRKTAQTDLSPEEADIKRLQSELLKCGVRKFWGKELQPFPTPRAKISHLKQILKDVGMQGRFSMDKARAIKERRELEADVTALNEAQGNDGSSDGESKGQSDSDENRKSDSPAPEVKRRKVLSRFVDFGEDDEDE